jgi:hypothetical protein
MIECRASDACDANYLNARSFARAFSVLTNTFGVLPMLKRKQAYWLLILLIATCSSIMAQRPQTQSQRAQEEAEQRRRDEEAVRNMPDYGADIAVVATSEATIYAEARATSRALLQVKRNDFLALVERAPVGGWYRVVEVDSATEGWVNGRDVIIKLTSETSAGPPIEEEATGTKSDPEVAITNAETGTDLSLRLNGTLYVIPANTTKVLTLKPGTFKYYGYSPGIRPAFGSRTFEAGYRYTWKFEIVRRD